MDQLFEFFKELVHPESIIRYGGIYLLLIVVFAETGLFVGFFLPGDSLLFTAGLFCATGILKIGLIWLILLIILAAVLGNIVGYHFGKRVGPYLFRRKSGIFFKQKHLETANRFYQKHGNKTIILCRFLPIVRTFAPIVAGIVRIKYHKFLFNSLVGALLWVNILVLTGYYLGIYVPKTKDYLEYIVIFLIVITSIPFVFNAIKLKIKKENK
ncbi:MAG TPA: VTT domain-containing protein [Bacteroidales bacterium]|nr:VTT domain-containing protein [Bacteroidales bacterium]